MLIVCLCALCRYMSRRSPGYEPLMSQYRQTLFKALPSVGVLAASHCAPGRGGFTLGVLFLQVTNDLLYLPDRFNLAFEVRGMLHRAVSSPGFQR